MSSAAWRPTGRARPVSPPALFQRITSAAGGAGAWRPSGVRARRGKERQEAGLKHIAFAASPEITTDWSQSTGDMPVRKSAIASQAMQDFFAKNPSYKVAVDQLSKPRRQDAALRH